MIQCLFILEIQVISSMILGDLEPITLMSMKYMLTYSCQIQIEHLIIEPSDFVEFL